MRTIGIIPLPSDPGKSQYVTCGGHQVPDWLWRVGFIEGGAGAVEPGQQRQGLWLMLMKSAVRLSLELGHRYMIGACEDGLLPMYSCMGFQYLEAREVEPKPNWRFRSNLIFLDMDLSLLNGFKAAG
jgi:hypothetical protein